MIVQCSDAALPVYHWQWFSNIPRRVQRGTGGHIVTTRMLRRFTADHCLLEEPKQRLNMLRVFEQL